MWRRWQLTWMIDPQGDGGTWQATAGPLERPGFNGRVCPSFRRCVSCSKGPCLPLVMVPTTAGTGSEVTPISILTTPTDEKKGVVSSCLYPDIAVLDTRSYRDDQPCGDVNGPPCPAVANPAAQILGPGGNGGSLTDLRDQSVADQQPRPSISSTAAYSGSFATAPASNTARWRGGMSAPSSCASPSST